MEKNIQNKIKINRRAKKYKKKTEIKTEIKTEKTRKNEGIEMK